MNHSLALAAAACALAACALGASVWASIREQGPPGWRSHSSLVAAAASVLLLGAAITT